MQVEEKYMMRCLELAKAGAPAVAPNPMVGAVIVHQGRIIGEGFHRRYGEAHAEVNAIASVRDESLLRDATLYVNLEPCAHYGKTPPCAALIIRKRIPRVVIGCSDPFPDVSGRGAGMLQEAGVEVTTGVMEQEAMFLNRFFITAQTLQRPYVILKWAQSADGFIDRLRADASGKPVQFSTPATLRTAHKLRSEVSAIMVGTNTALLDNPSLTVRHWAGASPVRVVLDRHLRIPSTSHLLDGTVRTLVFTGQPAASRENVEYIPFDFSKPVIPTVLQVLYERKLHSLLVEGGAALHESFLDAGLWDEMRIETSPIKLGDGVKTASVRLSESTEKQENSYGINVYYNKSDKFINNYKQMEI
ncbi:MAG: bifunctional diaminohydroxyphosphoribosylaminopyrimidine deaminase/5-amino-6-(5-phosphoribosylamino)uracil reductase RibD [Tannerella sp.]|jgi:diaminohydroxyphosphoribosylaminopyrimidine deaminase/5-amino-6-(5-phosphoribosylamino)uracil reductase|nr:bifunctional diaminohydroxyphosphoribosylaminopyrimidine deaminase/5-amino-6-(5-phosphoribosylamino)uracil reductase RibD [Tannerella sp.]